MRSLRAGRHIEDDIDPVTASSALLNDVVVRRQPGRKGLRLGAQTELISMTWCARRTVLRDVS